MTRTTVNASTVLGANYEIITLEPNNYNPQIDDEITITCTVQDVYGDPVANKSVTLYQDGTSEGTETTDNTGAATWALTFSDWDAHHLNVANATLNLKARGFKTVKNDSGIVVRANEDTVECKLVISTTNFPTSFTQFSGQTIPSGYRPNGSVICPCYNNTNLLVAILSNGNIMRRSMTGSSYNGACDCLLTWKY